MITNESISDLVTSISGVQNAAYQAGYKQGISNMELIYKALGWQGGTIHQVVDEIKKLKEIEDNVAEAQYERSHSYDSVQDEDGYMINPITGLSERHEK